MKLNTRLQSEGSSAARLLVLLVLVVALLAGAYWKMPAARDAINERVPFIKEKFDSAVPSPDAEESPAPPPAAAPPAPQDDAAMFQAIAADPTSWPRTVRLTKAVEFPAVVNGKEVGKITVKVGTEVNVARIKDGSIGVEYQGGGAWVKPADTDVLARARGGAPKPATPHAP